MAAALTFLPALALLAQPQDGAEAAPPAKRPRARAKKKAE